MASHTDTMPQGKSVIRVAKTTNQPSVIFAILPRTSGAVVVAKASFLTCLERAEVERSINRAVVVALVFPISLLRADKVGRAIEDKVAVTGGIAITRPHRGRNKKKEV